MVQLKLLGSINKTKLTEKRRNKIHPEGNKIEFEDQRRETHKILQREKRIDQTIINCILSLN